LVALWLLLAAAYLIASLTGQRVLAMAMVGLMVGAALVASGRIWAGVLTGALMVSLCIYFSDSLRFIIYAPPLVAFAFMALFFYRTLQPGSEALISRVARMEHPDLPADMAQYSRLLTWLWSICFMLLFVLALVLAPFLTLETWSRWVQGLGYALPGALFIGEYAFRHYRFRQREHGSLPTLIANIITVCRDVALTSHPHHGKPRQ
jgi:uncharacterized membrane protein